MQKYKEQMLKTLPKKSEELPVVFCFNPSKYELLDHKIL